MSIKSIDLIQPTLVLKVPYNFVSQNTGRR